jgi:GTPase
MALERPKAGHADAFPAGWTRAPRVVMVGRPNVGKSTLFNALCGLTGLHSQGGVSQRGARRFRPGGSGASIVSKVAGTTRDWKEGQASIGGASFSLVDTPGLEVLGDGSLGGVGLPSESYTIGADATGALFALETGIGASLSSPHEVEPGNTTAGTTLVTVAQRMAEQTFNALRNADVVWVVLDARDGVTPDDEALAKWVKRALAGDLSRVMVVVNKADGLADRGGADEWWAVLEADFARLGLGSESTAVSAAQGFGMIELLEHVERNADMVPQAETKAVMEATVPPAPRDREQRRQEQIESGDIAIAVVGRPNVGKSTLVNRLLGMERLLTGPMAGLTRDSTSVQWHYQGRDISLIDTAGMRRASKWDWSFSGGGLEAASASVAKAMLGRSQVVVLVLDAMLGLTKQDAAIAQAVVRQGRPLVIAANKADAIPDRPAMLRTVTDQVDSAVTSAKGCAIIGMSAAAGVGTDVLMPEVIRAHTRWSTRIPTARLNQWFEKVKLANPPPASSTSGGLAPLRLRYMTQVGTRPPTFSVFANRSSMPAPYERFLVNSLREEFDLWGIPIRIKVRGRVQQSAARRIERRASNRV